MTWTGAAGGEAVQGWALGVDDLGAGDSRRASLDPIPLARGSVMRSKSTLRRAIARVAPEASTLGVRVLLYHAVDDPDPTDPLAQRVSRSLFLKQMTLLRDEGYGVVPFDAVLNPDEGDDRPRVAVTFDDGYASQKWAASVLREFGFPATFFVVPRLLDGVRSPTTFWETWGHLAWEDAAALIEDGFEIGAHSTTHTDLTQCSSERLDDEVSGVKALLEERLGTDIVSFSYPHGRHDNRVRRAVEHAGYQRACTSRYGLNRTSSDAFCVRRTEVAGTDTLQDFRWKLRGKYDWLGYWQDIAPTR